MRRGVVIGAHVSYRDRDGFGRRAVDVRPAQLVEDIVEQWTVLDEEVGAAGGTVTFVKPHGALYNRMGADPAVAAAVVDAVSRLGGPVLVAQAGTVVVDLASRAGIRVVAEGFPDRGYLADGSLAPRDRPGALVDDPAAVARRAVSLVKRGGIEAVDGTWVRVEVETLCIHGDAPGAGETAAPGPVGPRGRGGRPPPLRVRRRTDAPDGRPPAVTARVGPYGDSALLVEVDDVSVRPPGGRRHRPGPDGTDGPAGIEETVVGFASVVVHLDGRRAGTEPTARRAVAGSNWSIGPGRGAGDHPAGSRADGAPPPHGHPRLLRRTRPRRGGRHHRWDAGGGRSSS